MAAPTPKMAIQIKPIFNDDAVGTHRAINAVIGRISSTR